MDDIQCGMGNFQNLNFRGNGEMSSSQSSDFSYVYIALGIYFSS
jgi:hypothetical protein